MKIIILAATLMLAGISQHSFAAGPNSFECIRPDGLVVCTVNAPSGDPSTICNRDCKECNMTCVARQHVVRDGNELIFNPGASAPKRSNQPRHGGIETRQYCRQQYRECVGACRNSSSNRSQYDVDVCTSSCSSVYSGCGRRP
jgi:hypothetical protein